MVSEMRKGYLEKLLKVNIFPSRSVLNRGMLRLNQKYVRRFNKCLVRKVLKRGKLTIVVDSTGIRLKTSSSWYDIRIKRRNKRKDNAKLHIALSINRNVITEYKITNWKRNDSPQLDFLLRNIDELLAVLADSGYPSIKNCNIVAKKNGTPFFKLKRNNGKNGHQVWDDMVEFSRSCKEIYDTIYHLRSIIESIMSALKRRYGNYVRAIKAKAKKYVNCLEDSCLQHQTETLP